MEKKFDVLAVGDVVIDAFIKLKDASVHCKINNEECEICMKWGSKIPYESATVVPAVGNSANAAVSASRLGLVASLRAYVGDDTFGKDCVKSLVTDGVDTSLIEHVSGKHTNYHYVLWYEDNRTILVKHETFDYTVPTLGTAPKWLYLSSLAENSVPYHAALMEQLTKWKTTKLAFQPGTFQLKLGVEALNEVYARSEIFFCNKEEAELVLQKPAGSNMKDLLVGIQKLGPKIVVITDDTRGAYAIDKTQHTWHLPRYPDPRPPYEITGAGDAFASSTVAAIALGLRLPKALLWGSANASAVLQEIGAQKGLLDRATLEEHIKHPPAPWKLDKL